MMPQKQTTDSERVRQALRDKSVPEHQIDADKDWGKAFRSRPGSADWRAHCSCGWQSSGFYYDETEALRGAVRHLGRVGV